MEHLDNFAKILELDNFNNNAYIQKLSQVTKQKPERISLALFLLVVCLLLFTSVGQLLLLYFIGFFYPSYKSYQALETVEDHDDKRWLTYWVVFGFLMAFVSFFSFFLDYLPMPKVLLSLLLFIIYSPLTNGYEYIYNFVIKKILKTYEVHVDKYIQIARDELKDKALREKKMAESSKKGE